MSSCQQLFDDLEKQEVHVFPSEPAVRRELRDVPMLGAKGTAGGHEEQLESVWVNGRELKRDSRVKDLQDGCNFLGINPSCSKSKLYDRLCSYVTKQFQKVRELAEVGVGTSAGCTEERNGETS